MKGNEIIFNNHQDVPFIQYKAFNSESALTAGFSTRLGGVSSGCYSSMNLGFGRGDEEAAVLENYRRLGAQAGFNPENVVLPNQQHTTNVRYVDHSLAGEGVFFPKCESPIDGQVTDIPGLVLFAFGADCPVVSFFDPVHRAVGIAHSGWRGTVNSISGVTVKLMYDCFYTKAEDLICVIGPSICRECYEVGADVAEQFIDKYDKESGVVSAGKVPGKYQLDLWKANVINLENCGVKRDNIHISGLCTKCNPNIFFSHRMHGNERGSCAGFIMLKEG